MSQVELYRPVDLMAAHDAWGANCGPGALAAMLGTSVMELRPLFPKPWTTPTVMQAALASQGARYVVHSSRVLPPAVLRGLAFVQLCGTWDKAPVTAQYQRTHWIGFERRDGQLFIYDVNAGTESERGGWQPSEAWKAGTLQEICAARRGASGLWYIRMTLELKSVRG